MITNAFILINYSETSNVYRAAWNEIYFMHSSDSKRSKTWSPRTRARYGNSRPLPALITNDCGWYDGNGRTYSEDHGHKDENVHKIFPLAQAKHTYGDGPRN